MAQVPVLGGVFGALARRFGVEASIVAHLSLNLVAVLAGVVASLLG